MSRKTHADKLSGGRADNVSPSKFDKKDVAEGAKHEKEHTKDPAVAAEIARDHLVEDKDYYRKLKRIEKSFTIPSGFYKSLSDYGTNWFESYRGTPFFVEAVNLERAHMAHEQERAEKKKEDEAVVAKRKKIYDEIRKLESKLPPFETEEWDWDQKFYRQHNKKMAELRTKYLDWCAEQVKENKEKPMSKSSVFDEIMARDISADLEPIEKSETGSEQQLNGTPGFGQEDEGRKALGDGESASGSLFREGLGFKPANLQGVTVVDLQSANPGDTNIMAKSDPFGVQRRAVLVSKLTSSPDAVRAQYSFGTDEAVAGILEKSGLYANEEPIVNMAAPIMKSRCCQLCKSNVPAFLTVCPNCNNNS